MARIEAADELRRFCRGVLDRLRLVQDCQMPAQRQEPIGVARQQRIGRYHQIGIIDVGKALGTVGTV